MNTHLTDISLQKLPPQNIEAEQSVLGAILLENSAVNKALEIIRLDDFYKESHRKIFSAMLDLSERNEGIDLITLTEQLKSKNALEAVGGTGYLSQLINVTPTSANVKFHSKIIHEKAVLRNLIFTAHEIESMCYELTEDVPDLIDLAEKKIFEISQEKIRSSFFPIKEIVRHSFEMIEKLYETREGITGVPSGFKGLDKMTTGFQPSDLVIIAGRPSMGKTALALNIAQHAGVHRHATVAVFSLEMSKEQLVLRMLCSEARVDAHKLRSGFLGREDWPRLTHAAGKLTEAKIFIDDTPAMSILEMRAKARRLKAEHQLHMIIVDYLQLMRGRGNADNREQEISDISRSLKSLAKELQVPVLALSQLSRAVESRNDKRPMLSDLRESGAIEQDADVVIFIYRDEVYHPNNEEKKGTAEINIGKQRNGPIGTVDLVYNNQYTRFDDPYLQPG
ncbi:MAG: replicative DNA helicase [Nitrospirae bacterium]|nr:replicative DNA helicase [Nitrospirota bacterium]